MAERCSDPTCLTHWPVSTEPVHLSLHTAPPPVERSTGYPRRDIRWTTDGYAILTFPLDPHPLDDGDPDE